MEQSQGWLSEREIIRWWEARRFRFNLYVGIIGVATWFLVLIAGSAAVKPGVDFEEPIVMLIGPFIYGILANICYTFGEFVDTVFYCGMPRTRLYKAGMIFSVVLTARCLGCRGVANHCDYRTQTRLMTGEKSPLHSQK